MNSSLFANLDLASAALFIAPFAVVVNFVSFVHECGHLLVGRWCGVKAEAFSVGMGPELFGFTDRYGTRWRLSAIPIGGYVRFASDRSAASAGEGDGTARVDITQRAASLAAQPLPARAAIVAAGPAANLVAAILAFAGLAYFVGETIVPPRVGGIVAGSAAEASGLKPGDLIESVDGRPVAAFEDIANFVSLRPGQPVSLAIERGGRDITIVATPILTTLDTPAGRTRIGRLGITVSRNDVGVVTVRPDLIGALQLGFVRCWTIVAVTGDYAGRMVMGRVAPDQFSGPIGIARMSHAAASLGGAAFIELTAILSLSLCLTNLLPVPLLDGGHLLFYGIEAVRGRPLSRRTQEFGLRVGASLMLMLVLIVTVNDVRRLFES
jgi:regulator of sigma E protease